MYYPLNFFLAPLADYLYLYFKFFGACGGLYLSLINFLVPKTRYLYLFLKFFGACGGLHYRLNFLAPAASYLHLYIKFSAPTGGYLFHLKFLAQRRATVLHIKFFSACNWILYYTSNFSAPAASYMHYPLEYFGARTELF